MLYLSNLLKVHINNIGQVVIKMKNVLSIDIFSVRDNAFFILIITWPMSLIWTFNKFDKYNIM